ncbi:MBL fold metallo-hydrolase [Mucilaginibacter limnophilus]|uniref:MBL fold metallo-hydrolase n=1 Tax=Mucilaginibacter limnophilus TaxID=1932778 RepID=A0A437MHP9_9SPHI|nr:MBL fold metallo-hydrolase [Mucilaginibacter limnophilus]RVT97167.1 MBL fold metallo-hydrolase [Mucilaginibacter limnophilus]
MLIHQFYDKGLAHASYAVLRGGQIALIDPGRNPQPYYDFATLHEAKIVAVIETHLHADFASSHLEIHNTCGATVYISKHAEAEYPHQTFDDGDTLPLDDIKLKAINTPGHSPDSICVLVEDENGCDVAIFTGDTLFVGDVGRPDLRETTGISAKKEELARHLYHSTRDKLMKLPKEVVVYPAHGPGSLCGKNISADLQSTIEREIRDNYALQLMDELKFVNLMLSEQPFMPKYFGFDVAANKTGLPAFEPSVEAVIEGREASLQENTLIIDTRPKGNFVQGHAKGAINLQDGDKFETWLGSIVAPDEAFMLIAATANDLQSMAEKAAKIGYEKNIASVSTSPQGEEKSPAFAADDINDNPGKYTIIDVRNAGEVKSGKAFSNAINIPLPELRERISEIPTDKPIVVHCAAGYRSAAASSIIQALISNVPVYDMGERIQQMLVHG